MTYFGGSRAFLCPPLPKGEILSGISSFGLGELGGDDVFRTRPDTSSLFGWGNERDGMPPSSSPTSSIYSLYNPSRSRTHLNATPSALSSNTGEDSGSADGSSDAGSSCATRARISCDGAGSARPRCCARRMTSERRCRREPRRCARPSRRCAREWALGELQVVAFERAVNGSLCIPSCLIL